MRINENSSFYFLAEAAPSGGEDAPRFWVRLPDGAGTTSGGVDTEPDSDMLSLISLGATSSLPTVGPFAALPSLRLLNSSSDRQMKRDRSFHENLRLTFLKMKSSSDSVKFVGRILTASMKLYTLTRGSEAPAAGVILMRGLGS